MQTRTPPPAGDAPPPPYTRVIRRVYPYSLRPLVIGISIFGLIWGAAVGVSNIQDVGDEGATKKINAFSVVLAIMYFVVAGVGLFAMGVAIAQKLKVARLFVVIAPLGALVAVAAEILNTVVHYTLKSDLIQHCTQVEIGTRVKDYYGNVTELTEAQAKDWCEDSWGRGTWRCYVYLFAVLFVACLWCSVTLSYYRQLLDPSSVRTRQPRNGNGNQPQSYALQPQPPYQNHPDYQQPPYSGGDYAGVGSQGYVPPYPGPPPAGSPWAPKNGDGDAKELDGRDMTYEAQERAWSEAQSGGPTVNAGSQSQYDQNREFGGTAVSRGHNEEEDEAWRLAAENGPTAHLTGDTTRQGGMRV